MTPKELDFSTFCIGILADHLGMNQRDVYDLLSKSELLFGYIVPCYSSLHTFGGGFPLPQKIIRVLNKKRKKGHNH